MVDDEVVGANAGRRHCEGKVITAGEAGLLEDSSMSVSSPGSLRVAMHCVERSGGTILLALWPGGADTHSHAWGSALETRMCAAREHS